MANFAPKRVTYDTGDRRWLRDALTAGTHGVTVNYADVSAAIGSNGYVPSGTHIEGEGLLLNDLAIATGEKHLVAVVHSGAVDRRYLPVALTAEEEAALGQITFINGDVPEEEG